MQKFRPSLFEELNYSSNCCRLLSKFSENKNKSPGRGGRSVEGSNPGFADKLLINWQSLDKNKHNW